MGGEDASEFWERVPGTYFFLGTKAGGRFRRQVCTIMSTSWWMKPIYIAERQL